MKPTRTVRSLALLIISLACSTAPLTGRKELTLVGDGTMNQLGAQTYAQELAKAKPSGDAAANAMVQRVAKRIADAAEANFHPGYQWQVTLIDDPKTVNAWCLPGGKIAVYSGILPLTQDESGLAVVLAHETSHALAHHGAERMSRMELMQLGEAGILAAVGAAKPQAVQMVGAALGLGAQLGVELPFSRRLRPGGGGGLLAADDGVRKGQGAAGIPLRPPLERRPGRGHPARDARGEGELRRAPVEKK